MKITVLGHFPARESTGIPLQRSQFLLPENGLNSVRARLQFWKFNFLGQPNMHVIEYNSTTILHIYTMCALILCEYGRNAWWRKRRWWRWRRRQRFCFSSSFGALFVMRSVFIRQIDRETFTLKKLLLLCTQNFDLMYMFTFIHHRHLQMSSY